MSFGVITPNGIMLSIKEFESLPDYSCSLPSGTIVGKRWRRRIPYRTDQPGPYEFYLAEYVESKLPGQIGITWTKIILPEGYTPKELKQC